MSERRTRANSAPLNARVTLDLANRLRQHIADRNCGNISDFVTAAIEEKLARDSLHANATQLVPDESMPERPHVSASGSVDSQLAC